EIKQFIGYQEIRQFSVLVNKCGIYDEDSRARSTYYRAVNEKKNGGQNHGSKPYANLVNGGALTLSDVSNVVRLNIVWLS
ncbi:ATP-dependent RNA helicase glh-2-like, partial [Trifolium medium]|nr:ATP-dependent RNA helicase glh-2-like [Trifolium medium]